eukprot:1144183-Pelagomonas_calceolata.AAC.2
MAGYRRHRQKVTQLAQGKARYRANEDLEGRLPYSWTPGFSFSCSPSPCVQPPPPKPPEYEEHYLIIIGFLSRGLSLFCSAGMLGSCSIQRGDGVGISLICPEGRNKIQQGECSSSSRTKVGRLAWDEAHKAPRPMYYLPLPSGICRNESNARLLFSLLLIGKHCFVCPARHSIIKW